MKLIVLLSGAGSTIAHLTEQEDMQVVLAISQNSKAIDVINEKKIPLLITKDQDMICDVIRVVDFDLIILAGYSRLMPIRPIFRNRILNIHPSLLPKFGGKGMYDLKVHQAVIDSKSEYSGCTVHVVDEHYDTGEILAQAIVPITVDDTAKTLQQKVKASEKIIYHKVIREYWNRIKNLY